MRRMAVWLALPIVVSGCAGQHVGAAPAASPTAVVGPHLEVSPGTTATGVTRLTVTGSGFDETKGIYVAYCLVPQPGQPPTPCAGGADTSGELAASVWVSSNPPPYGKDLAIPFEPGGSFEVQIAVPPAIDDIDCRVQTCGIATRADHTLGSDRSQDVFVPITFQGESE